MAEGMEAVVLAGQAIGDAKQAPAGVIPYAVIPEGSKVEDLERLLPVPARTRAAVTAKSAETFAAYVKAFALPATVVFGDQERFQLVGIIDYHAKDAPAFREHRVTYSAPRSLEWKTWRGSNGKTMAQADFARFIEDNVVDIRDPAGAEVLEVSRGLQAKKSVEFASAIRLADGSQQFTYAETIAGTTSKGTMQVPEEFTLGIPVFLGGPLYEVRARLRYRIDGGKLQLWYDLYRPEHIERDAFGTICADITASTGIAVWEGMPE